MLVYRCKQCGWICKAEMKGDIGTAHAHAEKHQGPKIFGIELPSILPTANPELLGQHIEELWVKVEDVKREEVIYNPVEGPNLRLIDTLLNVGFGYKTENRKRFEEYHEERSDIE